ncbi:hypothetical protein ACK3TF_001813 [Chlorella vulgaris]
MAHLAQEDVDFLVGGPEQVEAVAVNHSAKFVSGGTQAAEESELLTQGGLHPGSPRHAPQRLDSFLDQHSHQPAAAKEHPGGIVSGSTGMQQQSTGSGGSGSAAEPADEASMAAGAYAVAAESLDFASEEMDAE